MEENTSFGSFVMVYSIGNRQKWGFYYDNEKRPNDQPAHFFADCFVVCASWICGCQTSEKAKVSTHYYKRKTFKYAQVKTLVKRI